MSAPTPSCGDVDGLAALPPGLRLAAALAEIEPAKLPAHDVVLVARAWERLKAHAEAQQARVFAELASRPEYERCTYPDHARGVHQHRAVQTAGSEISLALAWSPGRATRRVAVAVDLVHDLPDTLTALSAGHIDADKATLIADRTRCLNTLELRRSVEHAVLPIAARKTRAVLDTILRREVIAADPGAAERRRSDAADQRRVDRPEPASPDGEDGMAHLYLYGPAEDLTALWTALDAAARHT
ncbi:DUF222 domain-containing protein, partial [Jiangella asiatica]|uniref:DUF222 domain-containing protein n=1 Tax=Jiangella asiatica TaxID=2530372 RepID=UPI0013A5E143